jgi:hypothetical protein
LKDSYYQAALKNCERAINSRAAKQVNLFQHVGGM